MSLSAPQKRIKIIPACKKLLQKAGSGGLSKDIIMRAQQTFSNSNYNFKPLASEYIQELENAIQQTETVLKAQSRPTPITLKDDTIIQSVMQIKANGAMFDYPLLSEVADICLQFIETLKGYNAEALEIINAHNDIFKLIIDKNIKQNRDDFRYELIIELHHACERYHKKHSA